MALHRVPERKRASMPAKCQVSKREGVRQKEADTGKLLPEAAEPLKLKLKQKSQNFRIV